MKKHLCAIAAFTVFLAGCGPTYVVQSPPPTAPPVEEPTVTYQTFYDNLSPYGQWIDYPEYGYIWQPNVGPDFKPYATNGQWVYTEDGWTWSSGYNWGWATFHYGRWFLDPIYGWMWIPGYQWAPAWVSWRQSQDYYGWAPLGPNVSAGIAVSTYNPPTSYWCFVPHQYVNSPSVSNYYVNETRNVTIINNTTVINNNYTENNTSINNNRNTINNNVRNNFISGPDPREVSRFTGATVRPATVHQSTSPGEQFNNGQLSIYRPRINSNSGSNNNAGNSSSQQRIAPARVVPLNNARPNNNRTPEQQQGNPTNNLGGQNSNTPNSRPTITGRQEPTNNNQPISNPQNTRPNTFNNQNNQPADNPGINKDNSRVSGNQPARTTTPNVQQTQSNNNQPISNPQKSNPNRITNQNQQQVGNNGYKNSTNGPGTNQVQHANQNKNAIGNPNLNKTPATPQNQPSNKKTKHPTDKQKEQDKNKDQHN
jgi:hypothetical protein